MNVSIEILTASFLKLHITFCYLGDERNRNMNNRDKKKTIMNYRHLQCAARFPYSTQRGVAKFVDSAQLKP